MAGKGLVDSHPVKCPMVFPGMAVVLPKGAREMMGAGKVALRTEKHVIMVLVVQHGIDGAGRRHPDGTGGKPGIFVSVVGGFDLLVAVQHPLDGEVPQGEFQGGARLLPSFFGLAHLVCIELIKSYLLGEKEAWWAEPVVPQELFW